MKIIIDISEYDKSWITNGYSIPQELNTDIARKIIEAEPLSFDVDEEALSSATDKEVGEESYKVTHVTDPDANTHTNNLPYEIVVKAIEGPVYYREEQKGQYTRKILKYEKPKYLMSSDFGLGLIEVIRPINDRTYDVVDYLFFDDFNKTWALTEEDLKGQTTNECAG